MLFHSSLNYIFLFFVLLLILPNKNEPPINWVSNFRGSFHIGGILMSRKKYDEDLKKDNSGI